MSDIVPSKADFDEACYIVQNRWGESSPPMAFNACRIIALYTANLAKKLEADKPDFDAILLAARKRRERQNWISLCDREDAKTWFARQAEQERAQLLHEAFSLDPNPDLHDRIMPYKGAELE